MDTSSKSRYIHFRRRTGHRPFGSSILDACHPPSEVELLRFWMATRKAERLAEPLTGEDLEGVGPIDAESEAPRRP
ncbi:MAG: hypothetical protein FIA97_00450 [Methylococcaceae bacterium]|nr:hypothetical protein [Methylococcaceae bacterium]